MRSAGLLWRARVRAFAAEFGCSWQSDLVAHMGKGVLLEHRELIREMMLPGDFNFPSNRSRLYETNPRKSRKATNREFIEAAGVGVQSFRPALPVTVFRSTPDEKFYSAVSEGGADELFPDRVANYLSR